MPAVRISRRDGASLARERTLLGREERAMTWKEYLTAKGIDLDSEMGSDSNKDDKQTKQDKQDKQDFQDNKDNKDNHNSVHNTNDDNGQFVETIKDEIKTLVEANKTLVEANRQLALAGNSGAAQRSVEDILHEAFKESED